MVCYEIENLSFCLFLSVCLLLTINYLLHFLSSPIDSKTPYNIKNNNLTTNNIKNNNLTTDYIINNNLTTDNIKLIGTTKPDNRCHHFLNPTVSSLQRTKNKADEIFFGAKN